MELKKEKLGYCTVFEIGLSLKLFLFLKIMFFI